MPRSMNRQFAPLFALLLLAGCTDSFTGPPSVAPGSALSRADGSTHALRRKDHAFASKKPGGATLYLDDEGLVIHDGAGHEQVLDAKSYGVLRHAFERTARMDAVLASLESNAGFQSCLSKAMAHPHQIRLSKPKPGIASSAPTFSPNRASLSLAPTGARLLVDVTDATYCQEVAMGLYEATKYYNEARENYFEALGLAVLSGAVISGGGGGELIYDPTQAVSLVGGATLEYFAYTYAAATVYTGLWGTWFNLGGCGSPTATYGYYDTPDGTVTTCTKEQITIEISYDGGLTWLTYWEGEANVCQ
jgi:hypothetical protein